MLGKSCDDLVVGTKFGELGVHPPKNCNSLQDEKNTTPPVFCLGLLNALNAQDLKSYKDYDFVPGDKIIFQDDFSSDVVGKAPANWTMLGGSAVVRAEGDEKYVSLLEYYTKMSPKIKGMNYLPDAYTIEFDTWLAAGYDGNPGVQVNFNLDGEPVATFTPNRDQFHLRYPQGEASADTPEDMDHEDYYDKWHHIAIAYRNKQMEFYVNHHHVLSAPNVNFDAATISINGNTSSDMPLYFKNFKFAEGGNVIAKAMSDGKFVTHGINFDVAKSTLRPESMGVLNEVAKYLKANPSVNFEVGGHTDSDGDDASNLALSVARAEAVKKQLIAMGVTATQLKTQGYGETKPIDVNTTPAGKANNRRVEFIKNE